MSVGFVHKRLSIRERGHLPNTLRLRPIKEITTYDDGLEIYRGSRRIFVRWSEIENTRVVKRNSVKGYGAAAGVDYLKKTFSFKAKDQSYSFDVSSSFPDFNNSSKLKAVLYKNLNVNEVEARSSNDKLYNICLLYTSPSPRDKRQSRMPSSA